MRRLKAITLIELLVTLAIFGIVATIAIPFSLQQLQKNRAKQEAQSLVSLLRLTQQRGISGQQASKFGVKFNNSNYVIYRGDNFASASQRETINLPPNISISSINLTNGGSEVTFSSGELRASSYGNIELGNAANLYRVTINSEGLIDYQKL